jgi:hypothetical protein
MFRMRRTTHLSVGPCLIFRRRSWPDYGHRPGRFVVLPARTLFQINSFNEMLIRETAMDNGWPMAVVGGGAYLQTERSTSTVSVNVTGHQVAAAKRKRIKVIESAPSSFACDFVLLEMMAFVVCVVVPRRMAFTQSKRMKSSTVSSKRGTFFPVACVLRSV